MDYFVRYGRAIHVEAVRESLAMLLDALRRRGRTSATPASWLRQTC